MSKTFRSLLCASAAVLAVSAASPAFADAMHSLCAYASPNCVDNGTFTPENVTNTPNFGWWDSGAAGKTGNFYLEVLIPDNVAGANSESFTINGTNTGNASATSSLVSTTAWTSGKLDAYLGISASPNNPIGAFLPNSQVYQSAATGYFVYTFNFGSVTWGSGQNGINPNFSSTFSYPAGTYIAGFFYSCTAVPGHRSCGWTATANSSDLLIGHMNQVPEPASLLLLGSGLLGLAGLRRRRASKA